MSGGFAQFFQLVLRSSQSVTIKVANGLRRAASYANLSVVVPFCMLVGITVGITACDLERAKDFQFLGGDLNTYSHDWLRKLAQPLRGRGRETSKVANSNLRYSTA